MSDELLQRLLDQFRLEPTPEHAFAFTTEFVRSGFEELAPGHLTPNITYTVKEPFPPHSNPFRYDYFHMGTPIGNNIMIMHRVHDNQKAEYIIVVNIETGERIGLIFNDDAMMMP